MKSLSIILCYKSEKRFLEYYKASNSPGLFTKESYGGFPCHIKRNSGLINLYVCFKFRKWALLSLFKCIYSPNLPGTTHNFSTNTSLWLMLNIVERYSFVLRFIICANIPY